jgi:hypothetical protein
VDQQIAQLWDDIESKHLHVQRAVVAQLDEHRALRPDLDVLTATEILWTFNHPSVWHLLVRGADGPANCTSSGRAAPSAPSCSTAGSGQSGETSRILPRTGRAERAWEGLIRLRLSLDPWTSEGTTVSISGCKLQAEGVPC